MYASTYIQGGETVEVTAPSGGMTDGVAYQIGNLFGVAVTANGEAAVLVGEVCQLETVGVHDLPKLNTNAYTQGQIVYWDPATGKVTGVAGALDAVGVSMGIYASGATSAQIRFNGHIPA
jgi:predicted RecA/RadA family phage recombinase